MIENINSDDDLLIIIKESWKLVDMIVDGSLDEDNDLKVNN